MTTNLFITLVTILSLVSSLLTEAVKKTFHSTKPTLLAAIISAIVGWGGGAASYILMDIPFETKSIVALVLLAPIIWIGATVGYDKVKEIIHQIINSIAGKDAGKEKE